MKESKLIILLKSLSSVEFKLFYKFVKSPYYNVNNNLVNLYKLLSKYYPDFEHSKLTYQAIFTSLFPREGFDIQRLRVLFHRLTKLVESFLVAEQIRTDDFLNKKLLTRGLERMNTYDLFQKKTDELLQTLEESPYRDVDYFRNKEQLNLQFYAHPATNKQENSTAYLTHAMESLDTYFVLSKIKLACAIGARTQTLSEKAEIKYLDMAMEKAKWSNLLIFIYVKIMELQNGVEEDIATFNKIRALYVTNLDKIGQKDKRDILHLLLNFSTRLINKGESQFINYNLELYKIGLKYDSLLVNNEISEETFINIVSLGTMAKEFEWTKSFIEEYGNHLNDKIRFDAVLYSTAIWHFRKKEYWETIQLISNHIFTKPIQIILSKTILIRTYIELFLNDDSYYDLSIAHINTFEKYIRNNKVLSENGVEGYLNFCRFTKKIINFKYQGKDTFDIKNKINSVQNVRLKFWLLEKL
ncbi:MAG: hypothetical protein ACI8P3_002760 [Saprospiraceae bacterium]|jgi:hypothetical protein